MKKKKISKTNWPDFAGDLFAYLLGACLLCVNFVMIAFFGILYYEANKNVAAAIFFVASCCNNIIITALCFKGIKKLGEWK